MVEVTSKNIKKYKNNDLILIGMLLKNSIGLYKQTKQIELSKVMFCLIIMMMIESVLHTHTHLQSLTTNSYCKLTIGIVSYSSVYMNCYVCYCRHKTNWVVKPKNPVIFNIICWLAGSMGQMTHQPSVWCSKHYFFHNFL